MMSEEVKKGRSRGTGGGRRPRRRVRCVRGCSPFLRQMQQEKELRGAMDERDMRWMHGPSGMWMGMTDEHGMRWTHGSGGAGLGLLLPPHVPPQLLSTSGSWGCGRGVRGWSRSRNRGKGRTHADQQTAKWEGRFLRRLEAAVACTGACRWMGVLVCSTNCCRQFANCWVQLPVQWGPCWDVRLGEEA